MIRLLKFIKRRDVKLCLIIASILIISYDSYWFNTSGISLFINIRNIYALLLPFFLFAINYKKKYSRKNLNLLLFVVFSVLFSSIINGNGLGSPILIFSGMMMGLVSVNKYSANEFFSSFSNVVLVISTYSLLIWTLVSSQIIPSSPISNIGDAQMTTAYGCIFFPILLDTVIRNSSFFREPGVFMILLNISLIFELFILKTKYRRIRIGILISCLATTLSTAGIIIAGFIFFIYLFQQKVSIYTWSILFVVFSVLLSSEIIAEEYLNEMFGKFETMEEYGSGFSRYSSVIIPLNIFLENFIWGCGFTQFPIEYERIGYELFNRYVDSKGLATNTFMNVFAIFGFLFGAYMMYGLYKFCQLLSFGNRAYALCFCLIFFMMFSNESMPYFPFLYIFFYYGFNRNCLSKNKRIIINE